MEAVNLHQNKIFFHFLESLHHNYYLSARRKYVESKYICCLTDVGLSLVSQQTNVFGNNSLSYVGPIWAHVRDQDLQTPS
jgi:hypothetical protein